VTQDILTINIASENDLILCRQRARQIAGLLGFEAQDQTRIATAVSEIARNAFRYAGKGKTTFVLEGITSPQLFLIRISDKGPGIPNLKNILEGDYRSLTGVGLGLIGAKRLMDHFDIQTDLGTGTTVSLKKLLPRKSPIVDRRRLSEIGQLLTQAKPQNLVEEVQQQNQELLRALEELRRRQDELTQLNHELEDTNRGVVALYAELDEKADHLRRADEMKSRFLSNMSHEFRTPLNSVVALSRLLLDRIDGELTSEQEKQVLFIRKSAESLTELVNDLLDLAKVESGKITINPTRFSAENLFGALRGMLRPLLVGTVVNLIFEDGSSLPHLYTDEGKVSQILRNFISNALKFTEKGEIRVAAYFDEEQDAFRLAVSDTGIGIAREDRETIFQEFAQIDHAIQRRVKGTGLGLPLSKRLAELLGGSIGLQSEPGLGSTFVVTLPRLYQGKEEEPPRLDGLDSTRFPVLIVEDNDETRLIYEAYLRNTPFQMIPARSLQQARYALRDFQPAAIILDVLLKGEDTWQFLAELKDQARPKSIPVAVVTTVEDQGKALALGADSFAVKPISRDWLLKILGSLTGQSAIKTALLIDDEEVARYLVRQSLGGLNVNIIEANTGETGLKMAVEKMPDLVILDLGLPGMSGKQVLELLKADVRTERIPVIVVTSQLLGVEDIDAIKKKALSVVSKAELGGRQAAERFQAIIKGSGIPNMHEILRTESPRQP
jgi:signal transduction histidine kinase/DNA-binding response OmpR family regulator